MAITIYRHPDYNGEEYIMNNFLEYKFRNKAELLIIEKYFDIWEEYSFDEIIFLKTNKNILRRIKITILNRKEDYLILKRVLENSKSVSPEYVLESYLSPYVKAFIRDITV